MAVVSGARVDVSLKTAAWWCGSKDGGLADVVLAVDVTAANDGDGEEEQKLWQRLGGGGVLLERADAADEQPCVLTLSCVPAGLAAIGRLTLVSEARTMEVYLPSGEYCATVRGRKQDHVSRGDRGPFYRKQLSLDEATPACDVKLLSLAGRSSVLLCGAAVALLPAAPRDAGVAIDLQRVQDLVDQMGGGLSSGARDLMDMLRLQQKNQSGFLPLLMAGGLLGPQPGLGTAAVQPPADCVGPAPQAAHLMQRFLSGEREDHLLPALLPVLRQLKLERNNTQSVDTSMERRLEEMERRLKEHVDRRLDALERKLDKALLAVSQRGTPSAPPPARNRAPPVLAEQRDAAEDAH